MPKVQVKKGKSAALFTPKPVQILTDFVLPGRPQNTNNLYRKSKFSVYMTKAGKEYKGKVEEALRKYFHPLNFYQETLPVLSYNPFRLDITYWVKPGVSYAEAQLWAFDVDGSHKILIDTCIDFFCSYFGWHIDDKTIYTCTFRKRLMSDTKAKTELNQEYPEGYTLVNLITLGPDEI